MSDTIQPEPIKLPEVKPCPFCGGSDVHQHNSNKEHMVLTHKDDCHLGRITVFKIVGDPKLEKWNNRA